MARSRKSRLDIGERESAIAVESDPVEAGINEHLDGRTTDGVGRYQNWTGGWR